MNLIQESIVNVLRLDSKKYTMQLWNLNKKNVLDDNDF